MIRSSLQTTVEEAAAALRRSAYSTNIRSRRDASYAIHDSDFTSITQARVSSPGHLNILSFALSKTIEVYGVENLSPGDGILMNDPFMGGTHLPDMILMTPVFFRQEVFAYMVNLAHHVDVGGRALGGTPYDSTDIYQEGLRLSGVRLVKDNAIDEGIMKIILSNVRMSRERAGDYRAQVTGNIVGTRKILELIERFGAEKLKLAMKEIVNHAERMMRMELQKLGDGSSTATDYMDGDGITDQPLKLVAKVTFKRGECAIDLSGTNKQVKGPMNSTYATTYSLCLYPLKCLVDPTVPINGGCFRPFQVIAPSGTIANARPPAAISGCWEVAYGIEQTVIRALSKLFPDKVPAKCKFGGINISWGGTDPRSGEFYLNYESEGGGHGGRPTKDGMDGVNCLYQNTANSQIEELEVQFPILFLRRELVQDSGGAGKYRGGLGIRKEIKCLLDHTITVSVLGDGIKFPPWGLYGGKEGKPPRFLIDPDSPKPRELSSKFRVDLESGHVFSLQMSGGGGYGDPLERDAEKVLEDVRNEKVSLEKAREQYGVVIDINALQVDYEATTRIRAEMRGAGRHL